MSVSVTIRMNDTDYFIHSWLAMLPPLTPAVRTELVGHILKLSETDNKISPVNRHTKCPSVLPILRTGEFFLSLVVSCLQENAGYQ